MLTHWSYVYLALTDRFNLIFFNDYSSWKHIKTMHRWGLFTMFTQWVLRSNSKSMEHLFYCNSIPGHQIGTKLLISHENRIVRSCAELCNDCFIIIWQSKMHVNGSVKDSSISWVSAMEIMPSCTKPLMFSLSISLSHTNTHSHAHTHTHSQTYWTPQGIPEAHCYQVCQSQHHTRRHRR